MKTWAVYVNAENKIQVVEQGQNMAALFFTGFWALAKGLYVPAIAMLAIALIVNAFDAWNGPLFVLGGETPIGLSLIVGLVAGIVFCIYGNKWVEKELLNNGYVLKGTCKMKTKEAARQYFISWCNQHRAMHSKT